MKKNPAYIFIFLLIVFQACKAPNPDAETYSKYISKGNEISNTVQSVLLANVAGAMKEGGPQLAVEFCNLNAGGIVDSMNNIYGSTIARVSAKNRNPGNALNSKNDQLIWQIFEENTQVDTLISERQNLVYYKRINTAMPACLKCHGSVGTDIDEATSKKLNSLYPNDLATGYKLNDFRGLWKIEFIIN